MRRVASWSVRTLAVGLIVCARPENSSAAPSSSLAQPQERTPPTDTRALALFQESHRAYREGRFQAAVELLLEARRLKAEPVLLYDLGRAYEALGKPREAAEAYAQYIEEEPQAADRKAIEGRIATLRAQATELEAARKPAPEAPKKVDTTPPQPPPERRGDGLDAVPWVVGGTGLAILGTGLVFGAIANGKHDDAVSERVQADAQKKQDQAETFATIATVSIVAGAIVAAAGFAWAGIRLARPSARNTEPRVRVGVGVLEGTF